ncbi:MAG TPA: branched-chain amino acid ABC transporter permease [Ktedonobacteraceae bacterium]|nr:branched-chain amino acid ABC transporter permease [Ktedonobacteraceae bacterium]
MSLTATEQKTHASAQPPRFLGSRSRWLGFGIGVLLVIMFFSFASEDWFSIVNYTMITAIAALSLNVLSGYAGQISLGITFFMAIGAYTAALLGGTPPTSPLDPQGFGLSFLIWLPAAGVAAALVGALVGPVALRLRGFYLAIVTLALVFIGQYIFMNVAPITGGPQGRSFPIPGFGDLAFNQQNDYFGIAFTAGQQYFALILLVLILSALFVANVMRSRAGRAFRAVRDHEVGASIMGVNLFEAKMGAFILSSFLAGIAGALLASYTSYVTPDYWSLTLAIQFVAAIIVGGIATIWGSILGAAFVFGLPQVIDYFSLLPTSSNSGGLTSGNLNALIYGALIIIFLLFEPEGVIGLVRRIQALLHKSNRAKAEGGEPAEIIDLSSGPGSSVNLEDAAPVKGDSE